MEALVPDSGVEELWLHVLGPNGRTRVHKMGQHHPPHQATVPQAQVYDEILSSRIAKLLRYGTNRGGCTACLGGPAKRVW